MSQSSEYARLGNGNEAPHSDLFENELMDAVASADEATAESIAAPARDVIACKIAEDRRWHGRHPAQSQWPLPGALH